MKTMLSFADNNGRRFYATSQATMAAFAATQPSIETMSYAGTQQVRMDLLNRVGRGVYQSRDARLPFVLSVRQAGRPQVGSNFEEWIDFRATISDGRIITCHTGSLSAPTFDPDVDADLASEIFSELPE